MLSSPRGSRADAQPPAPAAAGAVPGRGEEVPVRRAGQELLATIRPRDVAGKTRRRLAAELVTKLTQTGKRIKTADAELKALAAATGSSLLQLHGIGPSGAARLLGDVGDIARACWEAVVVFGDATGN